MTKHSNKTVLTIGICLIVAGLLVPYILTHFLWQATWGFENEFRLILTHIQYVGLGLGTLLCFSSFFYHLYPVKYLLSNFLPKILLLTGSILSVLIVTEIILHNRYKDIQVGGQNSPSHFTFYRKYYHLNKWLFRDKDRDHDNKSNNYRILALGDSFTFGAGVKYIKDLYPTVLEERLNAGLSGSCNGIEVINTGVKGANTEQEYNYLKKEGILFNPDLLILGYVLNDAETKSAEIQKARQVIDSHFLPYPYGRFLAGYSFFYYLYEPRVRQLINKLTSFSQKTDHPVSTDQMYFYTNQIYSGDNLIAYRKLFDEFLEYCRSRKLKMLVVLFPKMGYVKKGTYPHLGIHSVIKKMVLENKMEFLDLLEPLKRSKIENLTVSETDAHPSKEVHHLAAKEIHKILLEKKLIPCLN